MHGFAGSPKASHIVVGQTDRDAALQRGANVSAVARSEGLDPPQLYGWRRKALASGVVAPLTEGTGKQIKFARVETESSDSVDIVIADMVVRVGGNFDPDHLVRVLRAARKA
ncbi:Transposase [Rhizobium leguminosarum bv. trifolii WSM2012]|nr:Transposase [Rhizobium leguminosarum bv. trifolii WSM2012]